MPADGVAWQCSHISTFMASKGKNEKVMPYASRRRCLAVQPHFKVLAGDKELVRDRLVLF